MTTYNHRGLNVPDIVQIPTQNNMGGMNHQPCSKPAPESTRLSRHLSSATVNIMLANIRLEDLIIDELELKITQPGQISMMIIMLQTGYADIAKAIAFSKALSEQVVGSNFIDCSDRATLQQIVDRLCSQGMIDQSSAKLVLEDRCRGGFIACLESINNNLKELLLLTSKLIKDLEPLKLVADSGDQVFSHLEFNTPQSIKPSFARLFNRLNTLNGYFLASAIISTEYFYKVANFGSLGAPVQHPKLGEIFQDFVKGDAIARLATVE